MPPRRPSSIGSTLGTIAYSAPETFSTNRLKKPSDVYAFGIMREWREAEAGGGWGARWLRHTCRRHCSLSGYR